MARVLFILKHRDNYFTDEDDQSYSRSQLSSGLMNSATFVQQALAMRGHETELVHVVDNNGIDREVHRFRPDIVVVEAYWVVPEKFEILARLHPKVTWVIRNHSATPFAANEGIIFDWSIRYMDYNNVVLCCNDPRTHHEVADLVHSYKRHWGREQIDRRVALLPNFYPTNFAFRPTPHKAPDAPLDIACFGAIRPLKNHMIQAVSAVRYAKRVGRPLRFHINGTRIEGRGDAILRNLQNMFDLLPDARLILHPWRNHADFITLVRQMDMGLQVSYTETFNIVTADMVSNGVPVIVSDEIDWVDPFFHADPNCSVSIVEAMDRVMRLTQEMPDWQGINADGIRRYNEDSMQHWLHFIEQRTHREIPEDSFFFVPQIEMGKIPTIHHGGRLPAITRNAEMREAPPSGWRAVTDWLRRNW